MTPVLDVAASVTGVRAQLSGILPILDVGPLVAPADAPSAARALIAGGAPALQLRAKTSSARELLDLARAIRTITREAGVLFVVNDRPDVALLAEADGVHLGQTDLPARAVRAWLPPSMIIGVSCHDPGQAAAAAREAVAAYIGYGPIYPTTSKIGADPVVGLAGLRAVRAAHPELVIVAIGGVTHARAPEVRAAGADAAAMISALLAGTELAQRTRDALQAWNAAAPPEHA